MIHVKRPLFVVILLLFLVPIFWLLSPYIIHRNGEDISPLTPTTEGVIPVLPDPSLPQPTVVMGGVLEPRAHRAEGVVQVIETDQGRILRLEDFDVLNGPDLRVYLSTDEQASQFIDLGPLRANRGDLNYSLSEQEEEIDFGVYDTVLIWCRAFGVLFASAQLEPQP